MWPFAFIDGAFKANVGRYAGGSIVWGSKGDGGVSGGGPTFDGCTFLIRVRVVGPPSTGARSSLP